MEDRETPRMHRYGESKTTRIMMATVPHVTSGLGLRKFLTDGFLLDWVYNYLKILPNSAVLSPPRRQTLYYVGKGPILWLRAHETCGSIWTKVFVTKQHYKQYTSPPRPVALLDDTAVYSNCSCDQVKKNKFGLSCSTYDWGENRVLVRKPQRKNNAGR
jgi:hypothetical protein